MENVRAEVFEGTARPDASAVAASIERRDFVYMLVAAVSVAVEAYMLAWWALQASPCWHFSVTPSPRFAWPDVQKFRGARAQAVTRGVLIKLLVGVAASSRIRRRRRRVQELRLLF